MPSCNSCRRGTGRATISHGDAPGYRPGGLGSLARPSSDPSMRPLARRSPPRSFRPRRSRGERGRDESTAAPAGEPTSTRKSWRSGVRISVSARSCDRAHGRAGSHRDAEAGSAGLAALHGDPQGARTPRGVARVARLSRRPGPGSRSRRARTPARRGRRGELRRASAGRPSNVPSLDVAVQRRSREGKRYFFQLCGPDDVAEQRGVVPALEPVRARVLMVRPADREVPTSLGYLRRRSPRPGRSGRRRGIRGPSGKRGRRGTTLGPARPFHRRFARSWCSVGGWRVQLRVGSTVRS